MTDEQLNLIISKLDKEDKYNVVDIGFRILFFGVSLLVLWIFTTVNSTKDQLNSLSIQYEYSQSAIVKMQEFTAQPRFTKEDFITNLVPLTNQVNSNTSELNARNLFMETTEADIKGLEQRVRDLEYQFENKR